MEALPPCFLFRLYYQDDCNWPTCLGVAGDYYLIIYNGWRAYVNDVHVTTSWDYVDEGESHNTSVYLSMMQLKANDVVTFKTEAIQDNVSTVRLWGFHHSVLTIEELGSIYV